MKVRFALLSLSIFIVPHPDSCGILETKVTTLPTGNTDRLRSIRNSKFKTENVCMQIRNLRWLSVVPIRLAPTVTRCTLSDYKVSFQLNKFQ